MRITLVIRELKNLFKICLKFELVEKRIILRVVSIIQVIVVSYKHIAVNAASSQQSEWSLCSATCGSGIQTRGRTCTAPPTREDGKDCSGDFSEVRACEKTNCPRSREHKLKKALNLVRLKV